MNLPNFLTLPFWNRLAEAHLTELILVLTAAIVVLLDRQVRKLVNRFTQSHGRLFRMGVFLLVCSVGYTTLSLGTAWALREGLGFRQGAYMAPIAFGILVIVAVSAERQRQV
jgi:hypothetical protein